MKSPEQPTQGGVPYWVKVLVGTPIALFGGIFTLGFGLFLFLYVVDRIGGGRPQPDLLELMLGWFIFGVMPLGVGLLLLKVISTSGRLWLRILLTVFLLFVVVAVDANFGPRNWHGLFRQEKLPGTDAATLKQTIISPHLDAQLTSGTNVLWCGTFQLAWNEVAALAGGNIQFDTSLPIITSLNKQTFTKDSIDASSYIAMAGFVRENIHEKIQKAVKEKFHGEFEPRFLPNKKWTPRPEDVVAYSCLYKNLSFPIPFERLDESLIFAGIKVRAFGISAYKDSQTNMYPQVLILDYQSPDDFVVELKTKSKGDRLILAKVLPKNSLDDTMMSIRDRITSTNVEFATTNDVLMVPRIKLDLTREYTELEQLLLIPKGTNLTKDLRVQSAVQNIQFEMNEKGVELKSESHLALGCAKQESPESPHLMIFNKPFLVLMEREGAKMPYFALWLDNPELLIPW